MTSKSLIPNFNQASQMMFKSEAWDKKKITILKISKIGGRDKRRANEFEIA